MKRCSTCGETKPVEEFYWRNKSEGTRNDTCKACSNQLNKDWYRRNRQRQLALKKEWRKKRRQITRKMLYDYLIAHPCKNCGERDPIVLEFHHRGNKKETVSRLATYGFNPQRLMAEIAKCDVLCANCHRRVTAKDRGWYRSTM